MACLCIELEAKCCCCSESVTENSPPRHEKGIWQGLAFWGESPPGSPENRTLDCLEAAGAGWGLLLSHQPLHPSLSCWVSLWQHIAQFIGKYHRSSPCFGWEQTLNPSGSCPAMGRVTFLWPTLTQSTPREVLEGALGFVEHCLHREQILG